MAYPDPPTTPPIPQRGDRTTFSDRVDAFLTWVAAIIPWLQGFVANFIQTLTSVAAGGANTFGYKFLTDIANTDPGPGFLKLGSATQNAATILRLDPVTGGVDITTIINALLARTSAVKGSLRLQKLNDPSAWLIFDVTGSTAATGFYNLTVVFRAGSAASPFENNDSIMLYIDPAGDKGEIGNFQAFPTIRVREEYASGVTPPTITNNTGAGTVRTLNSVAYNTIGASATLTNSVLTLPAGTYEFESSAPLFVGPNQQHRIGLRNITSNAFISFGSAIWANSTFQGTLVTLAICSGRFTISANSQISLVHFPNADATGGYAQNTSVFGGGNNVFAELNLRKVT